MDSPAAARALASVGDVCGVEHETHDDLCAAGDKAACLHALAESDQWRLLLQHCEAGEFLACQLISYPAPREIADEVADVQGVGGDLLRMSYSIPSVEWAATSQTYGDRPDKTSAQRWWGEFVDTLWGARDCLAFELYTDAAYNRAELMATCRPSLQTYSKALIELAGEQFGAAAYAQRAIIHFHVADQLLRITPPPPYALEAIARGVDELHHALQRAFDCGCGLTVVKRAVQRRREVEANALLLPAIAPGRAL